MKLVTGLIILVPGALANVFTEDFFYYKFYRGKIRKMKRTD
jgi:hypothetical protein